MFGIKCFPRVAWVYLRMHDKEWLYHLSIGSAFILCCVVLNFSMCFDQFPYKVVRM